MKNQGEKSKTHCKWRCIFLLKTTLWQWKKTSIKTVEESVSWNTFIHFLVGKTVHPSVQEISTLMPNSHWALFSHLVIHCSPLSMCSGLYHIFSHWTLKLPFNAVPIHPWKLLKHIYVGDSCLRRSPFPSCGPYARVDATQFPKYGYLPWQQLQQSLQNSPFKWLNGYVIYSLSEDLASVTH